MTGKRGMMEGGQAIEGRGGEGWSWADWKGRRDRARHERGRERREGRGEKETAYLNSFFVPFGLTHLFQLTSHTY